MSDERNREGCAVHLAYEHDLTLPQGRKLAELAIHALDPTFAPWSPLNLAEPEVAEAYLSSPLGMHATNAAVAGVDQLAQDAVANGMETAGAWFARGRVAEHRGDVVAQRRHLETCLGLDAAFEPARLDLGFLAFVAGDVPTAQRLLSGSSHPSAGSMLHTLSHYPPRRSSAGRNQPCPCGSGTKSKHCCGSVLAHDLADRTIWLWEKAALWLRRHPQHAALVDIADEIADPFGELDTAVYDDDLFDDDLYDDDLTAELDGRAASVLADPGFEGVALLDAGLIHRFAERMGPLLPADERDLLRRWGEVRHQVWRIEGLNSDSTVVLSDARGRVVDAQSVVLRRCAPPGGLAFAALLPTGEGWWVPAVPVDLDMEAADEVAQLAAEGADPLVVAARAFEGTLSATM
ncbi:MAG: SEC-C domain-containing protein [Acidimicrobiia bacterium]|nr:SEC-C domain-containing protein [Acidimicrobiia bacterium]